MLLFFWMLIWIFNWSFYLIQCPLAFSCVIFHSLSLSSFKIVTKMPHMYLFFLKVIFTFYSFPSNPVRMLIYDFLTIKLSHPMGIWIEWLWTRRRDCPIDRCTTVYLISMYNKKKFNLLLWISQNSAHLFIQWWIWVNDTDMDWQLQIIDQITFTSCMDCKQNADLGLVDCFYF